MELVTTFLLEEGVIREDDGRSDLCSLTFTLRGKFYADNPSVKIFDFASSPFRRAERKPLLKGEVADAGHLTERSCSLTFTLQQKFYAD